jgi:hypothetical protein
MHGENQVSLKNARLFYGYDSPTNSCKSLGGIFRVPPGSEVQVHITAESDQVDPYTKVIVRADWYNTKDHLVSLDLDKDFRSLERWIENRVAVLGLIIILLAAFFFVRERRQAKTSDRASS